EVRMLMPCHLEVQACAAEHKGLGTGTQLGLAVARGIALASGVTELPLADLARLVGRGARSALGVHGFAHGCFLVDGGKGRDTALAPLIARLDFPEAWRVVLVVPDDQQGLHGSQENEAFAQLGRGSHLRTTEALCRLVLLGLLPALRE